MLQFEESLSALLTFNNHLRFFMILQSEQLINDLKKANRWINNENKLKL